MRGPDEQTGSMFSYVSPEDRVPVDHPLRSIRRITDQALERLSPTFDSLYVEFGRPSVPFEQLLRALLLQVLYSIRSERLLMEQLDYNILFRWFVGLSLDAPVWDPTVFTKNRDRLLRGDVAAAFFDAVVLHADSKRLLSDEHFTVDGTQLEAWASLKSFKRRDAPPSDPPDDPGNPTVNFRGETRSNVTHASTTDSDAQLAKKADGQKSVMAYLDHLLMENRHGLIVNACATAATGTAEREAAAIMLPCGRRRGTPGANKNYDVANFLRVVRAAGLRRTWRRRRSTPRWTRARPGSLAKAKRRPHANRVRAVVETHSVRERAARRSRRESRLGVIRRR